MTTDQLQYWQLQESKRHNKEQERLSEKASKRESRDRRVAAYLQHKAQTQANKINALHNERYAFEQTRHNVAIENLQAMAHENDLARIQLGYDQLGSQKSIATINAGVGYAQVGATYANIAEQQRTHMAYEQLQQQAQQEILRSNLARESVNRQDATTRQTQANTARAQLQFEQDKWNAVGYDVAMADRVLKGAQTIQAWSSANKMEAETSVVGVNAASNLIGSGANVLRSLKGVNVGKK